MTPEVLGTTPTTGTLSGAVLSQEELIAGVASFCDVDPLRKALD